MGKPDPMNLDREYNCVRHIQDKFIDQNCQESTEQMSILMYRKVQPCPLRSTINQVKARMFANI